MEEVIRMTEDEARQWLIDNGVDISSETGKRSYTEIVEFLGGIPVSQTIEALDEDVAENRL